MQDNRIHIWTDGSAVPNPGDGGYGAILRYRLDLTNITETQLRKILEDETTTQPKPGIIQKTIMGGEEDTTNIRMEMVAVIKALEALKRSCEVVVHTDSELVMKGATEWMPKWKRKGWAKKGGIKNLDLWMRIDELIDYHTIEWVWVRGHAGNAMNELADRLANEGRREFTLAKIDKKGE